MKEKEEKTMTDKINDCAKKIEDNPRKYDEIVPKVIKLHHQETVYVWWLLALLTMVAGATIFDIAINGMSGLDESIFILMAANVVAIFSLANQRKTTPKILEPAIKTIKQMRFNGYSNDEKKTLQKLLIISCVFDKEKEALELLQTTSGTETITKLYETLENDMKKI